MPLRDLMGEQMCRLAGLNRKENKMVTTFAYVLFGVLSVHFVLVALWLMIVQRAKAPFFGHSEEVTGTKLMVWAVLLSCCGVSGVLAIALKSVRVSKQALGCWLIVLTIHTWYLVVGVFSSVWTSAEEEGSWLKWSMSHIILQLLADLINVGFLLWFVRHDTMKDQLLREPLLPVINEG